MFANTLTLALALLGHSTLADHFTCCYKPGSQAPSTYGFKRYCVATRINPANSNQVCAYVCRSDGGDNNSARISDWGFLAPKTLEIGQ